MLSACNVSSSTFEDKVDRKKAAKRHMEMVRAACCDEMGLKKGPWTHEEDRILVSYIQRYGHGNWRALPKEAGLSRCGKSCRLRWTNYLRPDVKRGDFSKEEEEAIIHLHALLGNRWSAIAAKLEEQVSTACSKSDASSFVITTKSCNVWWKEDFMDFQKGLPRSSNEDDIRFWMNLLAEAGDLEYFK